MPRRERATILGEILDVISDGTQGGEVKLTHVAVRCNMPYDRFRTYLRDMQDRGLLDANDPWKLTSMGQEFLLNYRRWRASLRLFGMDPQ